MPLLGFSHRAGEILNTQENGGGGAVERQFVGYALECVDESGWQGGGRKGGTNHNKNLYLKLFKLCVTPTRAQATTCQGPDTISDEHVVCSK